MNTLLRAADGHETSVEGSATAESDGNEAIPSEEQNA